MDHIAYKYLINFHNLNMIFNKLFNNNLLNVQNSKTFSYWIILSHLLIILKLALQLPIMAIMAIMVMDLMVTMGLMVTLVITVMVMAMAHQFLVILVVLFNLVVRQLLLSAFQRENLYQFPSLLHHLMNTLSPIYFQMST